MFRFFVAIVTLVLMSPTVSFATCSTGYYAGNVNLPIDAGSGDVDTDNISIIDNMWNIPLNERSGTPGTLTGVFSCNGQTASYEGASYYYGELSTTSTGVNCWCKATQWTPSGGSTYNLNAKWIYRNAKKNASTCAQNCAGTCTYVYNDGSGLLWNYLYGAEVCVPCPAKPDNATWTTGCNFACPAGQYQLTTVTGTVPITFPTTNGSTSTYNGSSRTWSVTWNNVGTASGSSACATSSTGSPKSSVSNSTSSSAKYCWCKITSWDSYNNLGAKWVYIANRTDGSTCRGTGTSGCAYYCSNYMKTDSSTRSSMFGTVTNTPTVTTTSTSCETCPDGGTSAGTGDVTSCYIPSTTNFNDSKGTYHYSSNCYYSN